MLFVLIAAVAAFTLGVVAGFEAFEHQLGIRRAYRSLRELPRTRRGHCDICLAKDVRVVDARIPDGSGGCEYHWSLRACRRAQLAGLARMDVADELRAERHLALAHEQADGLHPDDIPF